MKGFYDLVHLHVESNCITITGKIMENPSTIIFSAISLSYRKYIETHRSIIILIATGFLVYLQRKASHGSATVGQNKRNREIASASISMNYLATSSLDATLFDT